MSETNPLLDAMAAMASSKKGKLDFRGKLYSPVALRVERLREAYADQCAIYTDLVQRDDSAVVMRAEVWAVVNEDWVKLSTGFAEEIRSGKGVNSTSALENAETSAVGRALAALGLGGGEYASADELSGALGAQNQVSREKIDTAREGIKEAIKDRKANKVAEWYFSLNEHEKQIVMRELDNHKRGEVSKALSAYEGHRKGDDPSKLDEPFVETA